MVIEFKVFDPKTVTREDWNRYHVFRRLRSKETNPDDPINPDEVAERSIMQDYENEMVIAERYMILDSQEDGTSKQIGLFVIGTLTEKNPSYETNKQLAQFDLAILKEYRRKGIATRTLQYCIEFAKKNDKRLLITGTSEKDGKEFLQHIGASLALAGKENRLVMNEVNWDMVHQWITEGESLNKTTKLITCTEIPEEIIEQYAKFYTEINNQQPLGDLDVDNLKITPETLRIREKDFRELGYTSYTKITIEADGEISGMSEMIRKPGEETILSQGLTGVKETHRGRKLGKWLKSSMLNEMKEKYPQVKVVKTGNADVNAPMLSINHRLGFKPYKETNLAQISLEALEKYYNKKTIPHSTVV